MKIVSFINMKGGVGKTTLAVNIADCLNRRHSKRVLVIDVDPQFNCTQCFMSPVDYVDYRTNGKDTVLDVFDRPRLTTSATSGTKAKQSRDLGSIAPIQFRQGLDLLPGNLELYRLEMAPGEGRENRLRTYLTASKAAEKYDFVILDTPPTPSVWMTSALIASDYYLIPVKPDPLSLTGIDLLKGIIEDRTENFGLKLRCLGIALTMTRQGTVVLNEARQNLGNDAYWRDKLFATEIPARVKVAEHQLNHVFMLDMADADIKLAIARLTNECIKRLEDGKVEEA